jgi:DNA polymerase-1
MIPISNLIGKGKNQLRMDQVSVEQVTEYAAEDADATWRIEEILAAKIRSEGLWDLYASLERPLISVLARMEKAGIAVDTARLKQLSREFGERITVIETQVYAHVGHTFNINSGPQLRQVLFEELKLPSLAKTPGGEQSTAQDVLEELALKHPFPKLLLEHRQLSKLKGTYLDALPELVHPDDGRIHASFNQSVAATGRLSSSDPNLQNIPVRRDEGRQIRQAFVTDQPGYLLLTADYSQIELRILAHYSADPALCRAFEQGDDIHCVVAARIFGVPENEVDESQRRVAKTVNFGVVYGLSAFGLSNRLGITQTEAAAFIEAYFKEYAGVDQFITRTLEAAQAAGRVETILGRRPISGIKSTTGRSRNLAERTAINTVIQGSAADLIKQAMIVLDDRLIQGNYRARMLLQIHDELVFEAPADEIPRLALLVRDVMTKALDLSVPLEVDIAAGPNWLDVVSIPGANQSQ